MATHDGSLRHASASKAIFSTPLLTVKCFSSKVDLIDRRIPFNHRPIRIAGSLLDATKDETNERQAIGEARVESRLKYQKLVN